MIIFRIFSVFVSLFLFLFIISCDSDSTVQTEDKIIINATQISGCGGFINESKRANYDIPITIDPSTYCNAERLHWFYDEYTKTLYIMNSRILLNCCGDHTINASLEKGVLSISENDQPPADGSGRCRCICVYDFLIEISEISSGVITMRIDLTVDDTTSNKWEGKVDLKEENGEIIIDDKALENCTAMG